MSNDEPLSLEERFSDLPEDACVYGQEERCSFIDVLEVVGIFLGPGDAHHRTARHTVHKRCSKGIDVETSFPISLICAVFLKGTSQVGRKAS